MVICIDSDIDELRLLTEIESFSFMKTIWSEFIESFFFYCNMIEFLRSNSFT